MSVCLSASAGNIQTDAEGNEYREKSVKVYRAIRMDKNIRDGKITLRFYENQPNVAYVSIRDYYATVMKDSKEFEDPQMKVEKQADGKYLLTSETGSATLDAEKDILTTDDPLNFINQYSVTKEGDGCTVSSSLPFCRTAEVRSDKKETPYDMGKYHIDIRGDEDDVYFPLATLSDIGGDTFAHYILLFKWEEQLSDNFMLSKNTTCSAIAPKFEPRTLHHGNRNLLEIQRLRFFLCRNHFRLWLDEGLTAVVSNYLLFNVLPSSSGIETIVWCCSFIDNCPYTGLI